MRPDEETSVSPVREMVVTIGGSGFLGVEGNGSVRSRLRGAGAGNDLSPSTENIEARDGVAEGGISAGARSSAAASWSFRIDTSSLASMTAAESWTKHEGKSMLTSEFILETLAFLFNSSFIEELVFKENLLFEYFPISLLDIGEAG